MLSALSKVSVEGTVSESLSLFQVGMEVHDGKGGLFFFLIGIVLAEFLQGLELKLPVLVLDQKLYLAFDFSELLITQFYQPDTKESSRESSPDSSCSTILSNSSTTSSNFFFSFAAMAPS